MRPSLYVAAMEAQNPIVTNANISNEVEYWLSQKSPHEVLQIISNKFHEVGARHVNRRRRGAWEGLSKGLASLSDVAFEIWNRS